MRMRNWIVVTALVMVTSAVVAAPVGPGGRIYYTSVDYQSSGDNVTRLHRLDVDANWDIVTNLGEIATVKNDYNLLLGISSSGNRNATHLSVSSPELLHARANADGSATGGDGSVFLAGYYDSNLHTRYNQISADGTLVTVLHPGTGQNATSSADTANYTGGEFSTTFPNRTGYCVDRSGDATGQADSVFFGGSQDRAHGLWQDTNTNDDLSDETTFFGAARYIYGGFGGDDVETGGTPRNYAGTDNALWGNSSYNIKYQTWNPVAGNWSDPESTFYNYSTADPNRKYLFRNHGIAVGDVDGDGIIDVFACTSDPQGTAHAGGTIFRMADLTGDGTALQGDNDLWSIIYNDGTLAGTSNDLGNYGRVDLELIQDPTSGKWTLLVLEDSGKLYAIELADNGDRASGTEAVKLVLDGIDAGGSIVSNLYGIEFDADPMGEIPEPGTMLLLGTGVLSALGWLRRRRMR